MRLHNITIFDNYTRDELILIAWENSEYIINEYSELYEMNNMYITHLNPILKHLLKEEIKSLQIRRPKVKGLKQHRHGGLNIVNVFRHAFETTDNPTSINWRVKFEANSEATFIAGNAKEMILEHYSGRDSQITVVDEPEFNYLVPYLKGEIDFNGLVESLKLY